MDLYLTFANKFEELVQKGIARLPHVSSVSSDKPRAGDFTFQVADKTVLCEVKFSRSSNASLGVLRIGSLQLTKARSGDPNQRLLLIASFEVNELQKTTIKKEFGVTLWGREEVKAILSASDDLRFLEEFQSLLRESDPSIASEPRGKQTRLLVPGELTDPLIDVRPLQATPDITLKGSELYAGFYKIPAGRKHAKEFEKQCEQVLKYLFQEELSNWEPQIRTDDELSQIDLVARVSSNENFWHDVRHSFHTRYLLFEFKNYSEQIRGYEIYLTERYLYRTGLRSVAIIIARNGAHDHARDAAKGALREHGKLLLILDLNDLEEMLTMKDKGLLPSDLLVEKLDTFLMTISR
jgi:hypothetical protein